ncbi:TIGR02678 family protein [Allonocardiopsis opalescens]|uniref:Uncharacterized protein (TIGR02678 family) n=1 Tax=Allonocardiopsis opalescens TaxID=1144618 RepID=A0A2T0Q7Z8_9ACTN|nr:TIGR02678 family protein [Allonocardiopsis opalescens]PRX99949.1 uncharacterized protein (TIGR02678 family) [Allonocardiopsis opalescens]
MATKDDIALASERRTAVRLLLDRPLVTPRSHPEEFPLLRKHAEWLIQHFDELLGYRLVVEAGFARLTKAGLGRGTGHALTRASGAPFTPRAYAYLALALSVLVTAPEQLLLSELAHRIRAAAEEAGIDLGEPDRSAQRRAMVAALRQLVAWEALTEDEGSLAAYADSESAEVLITVDREIARRLVAAPLARAASADELIERAAAAGEAGPRHSVRRRLLETPVVYLDELSEAERAWWRREQRRETRHLLETYGLDAEVRTEGVALIDPNDQLTDVEFPGVGTVAQAALLLVDRLVRALAPDGGEAAGAGTAEPAAPRTRVAVPDDLIADTLDELVAEYGRGWSRAYVADPELLRDQALTLLARMRLVRREGDGWALLAAAARYADRDAV